MYNTFRTYPFWIEQLGQDADERYMIQQGLTYRILFFAEKSVTNTLPSAQLVAGLWSQMSRPKISSPPALPPSLAQPNKALRIYRRGTSDSFVGQEQEILIPP
jgi:hypothetical protein